jgi:hypothetical protein
MNSPTNINPSILRLEPPRHTDFDAKEYAVSIEVIEQCSR